MAVNEILTAGQLPITSLIQLGKNEKLTTIPTTLIPLSPFEITFEGSTADILHGLFHIMWKDMPRPRTYKLRLSERVSEKGEYIGPFLELQDDKRIKCH